MKKTTKKPGKITASGKRSLRILFSCIGRRVSLLKAFQRAGRQLNLNVTCYGTDINAASPALQLCDRMCLVRPASHRQYISDLMTLVKDHGIDLLIPTVDLDLKRLALRRQQFADLGCHVLVSRPSVIDLCQDKRKTYDFLIRHGFDTPITLSARSLLQTRSRRAPGYPCYIKPWDGYAGRFNVLVENRRELEFYARRIPHALCQAFIKGDEYTCDVYVDRQSRVRCAVPRLRMEVRAGEVSKARVVKDGVQLSPEVEFTLPGTTAYFWAWLDAPPASASPRPCGGK